MEKEMREITFGELRRILSVVDRVSICMEETLSYENYFCIRDVPHKFDEWYVCGIGGIRSEFPQDGNLHFMPCLEILVSKKTRTDTEKKWANHEKWIERKNKSKEKSGD